MKYTLQLLENENLDEMYAMTSGELDHYVDTHTRCNLEN